MNKKRIAYITSIVLLTCVQLRIVNNLQLRNQEYKQAIDYKDEEIRRLKGDVKELDYNLKNFEKALETTEDEVIRLQREIYKKDQELDKLKPPIGVSTEGPKMFTLTFYTELIEENSSAGPITCTGARLSKGMVASNVIPLGTELYLHKYGKVRVADRGGPNFNKSNRLDVFVPRKTNESVASYKKRVSSMGIQKVKGWILK